ncbi:unnamed protein product [Aphanomyces euteiches]|nr:hypothetical protein AeRB84_020265 [Aphanomyces euteiches]
MSSSTKCFFNDCQNEVLPGSWKCFFHRPRGSCLVSGCRNQVYARRRCVRHGGKPQCEVPDCNRNVRTGTLCSFHGSGPSKKRCTAPGCTKFAHNLSFCVSHGGRRQCKVPDCSTHARSGGYCCRHNRLLLQQAASADRFKCSSIQVHVDEDALAWTILSDFITTIDLTAIELEPTFSSFVLC